MRKLYTTICFVLFCITFAFGQAVVDIPLSASDGSATIQLAVGLDLTATNCLDPTLGESDLPPFPPQGVFEFRFDLQPACGDALSSYKDYRAPGDPPAFPYTGTIEHTIWWQVSSPSLDINISYNLPPNSAMRIQDQLGGVLINLGPYTGIGVATIPGAFTSSLNHAYLYMDYTDITPVELTSFTAMATGQEVLLNWRTATEVNNRGFDIERQLTAGSQWDNIGFVAGNGTTTVPQTYSYTDKNVPSGSYSYRLKQIDFNGTYSYSNIVNIKVGDIPDQYSLSQNYPNPFNPTTIIKYQVPKTSFVTIKIYNLVGQEVRTLFSGQVQQGTYAVEWNGLNNDGIHLSSGTYIYRIVSQEFTQSKKMILIK